MEKDKIQAATLHHPIHYVVFDILFYRGRDQRELTYLKRGSFLESVLKPNSFFSMPGDDQTSNCLKRYRRDMGYYSTLLPVQLVT